MRNKARGSDCERLFARVFRDLGFIFCETTRLMSKGLDNCKIDLVHLPWNVQIKGGVQKGMIPSKVFLQIEETLKKQFPPTSEHHSKPLVLIHRKKIYSKNCDDDLVYLTKEFYNTVPSCPTLGSRKYRSIPDGHKYNNLVIIRFADFIEHYVKLKYEINQC